MYIRKIRANTFITSSELENYKIYLITMDKTSQFWYILNQGVNDMANLLGATYIWDSPEERNVAKQVEIINNAVDNGADALILAASDPIKVSSAIENAKALGVKIIYVDAPANEEGVITLATDNYSAGIIAGENMLYELESLGIQSGSIGILGVTPETSTTVNRENGFRNVIEQDGRYKILTTEYSGGSKAQAQEAVEVFITGHPDLIGLFGTNEDTTISIGNAIKASDKGIVGIGFDFTPEILEMLYNGSLKAVLVQNPYTMGFLGMAETIAALKGYDTGPTYINTGVSTRTKYTH